MTSVTLGLITRWLVNNEVLVTVTVQVRMHRRVHALDREFPAPTIDAYSGERERASAGRQRERRNDERRRRRFRAFHRREC